MKNEENVCEYREKISKCKEKITECKMNQNSPNNDYYIGYMSAMSTCEGIIAEVFGND